jgi:hypothetical protein
MKDIRALSKNPACTKRKTQVKKLTTKNKFIKVNISIQVDKPGTMMKQGPGINHARQHKNAKNYLGVNTARKKNLLCYQLVHSNTDECGKQD